MQYSLALLAGAAMVAAQAVPSGIPACGQSCITNMIAIASTDFGCAQGNTTCYCSDPRFGFGLRDCSIQACGDQVYSSVLSYGTSVCSSGLAASTGAATAITASPTGTAAGNGTTAAGGVGGAGASGSSTPYTTSAILTTISSGSSAVATSTIGSSTLYTAVGGVIGGASGSASSAASSITGAASSAASSAASGASSVASSASSRVSSAASAASSAAGGATSSGLAAQMTAAPILGGAALAALFMI